MSLTPQNYFCNSQNYSEKKKHKSLINTKLISLL